MTEEDLFFPSESHRRSLVDKMHDDKGFKNFTSQERLEFHAYRYGWRRKFLKDFEMRYPADPAGDWFDGVLVGRAFEFYGGKIERRERRPDPTPDDIDHVARVCNMVRKNLDRFAENTRKPFTDNDLGAVQAGLGISVTAAE